MKRFSRRARILIAIVFVAFAVTTAYARGQREANRSHSPLDGVVVSGEIVSVSTTGLSVAETNGSTVNVDLARRARIAIGTQATFDMIASGDLVDVVASRGPGDILSATTVFLLPAGFTRAGRGGETTSANGEIRSYGKVTALSTDNHSRKLTVDHDGGSTTFTVGDSASIVKVSLSSASAFAIGSRVSVFGRRDGENVKGVLVIVGGP